MTIISSEITMTMSVWIRETEISKNRDYSFFSKIDNLLNSEREFFAHILKSEMKTVQIRNIFEKLYTIFRNFKIDRIKDYNEEECHLIASKNRHLTIKSDKQVMKVFSVLKSSFKYDKSLKTVLLNEVTCYENKAAVAQLFAIVEEYFDIWKNVASKVNLSSERWMKIKIISRVVSSSFRVFRLNAKNRVIVDKEFDALHDQDKMNWTIETTSYVFSVFVIWTTVHYLDKSSMRKERVVVNIRKLNKIIELDSYSMFLQFDIISNASECLYIEIMNELIFFHQWSAIVEDYFKLTIISHRESEYWKIEVMNVKNTSAYVQKKMNLLLKNFSWARVYIDDVVIFSKTLKEHLMHLTLIFSLFRKYNITFKVTKIYLSYSSIMLLEQKMNNLDMITAENKFKTITILTFSRNLKDLKTYLEMTERLRDYVLYYAQKTKALQIKKINLLKNESNQDLVRKEFSVRIMLKNSST